MKSITIFIIVSFVVINSCTKNENEKVNDGTIVKKIIYADQEKTFAYDTLGMLTQVTTTFTDDTLNVFNDAYIYKNDTLISILSDNNGSLQYLHNFNYTDSSIIRIISDFVVDKWIPNYKREYILNDEGYCTKEIIYEGSSNEMSFYYEYTWQNGNLITEKEVMSGGLFYLKTFTYDSNPNPFNFWWESNKTLVPFSTKNNPLSYQKTNESGYSFNKANYNYEYNKSGFITSCVFTNEYGEQLSYDIVY